MPVHKADKRYTFLSRLSKNSGSLSLREPAGPVQACNGIAVTVVLLSL